MNKIFFTEKLIADARFVKSEKSNFISLSLFDTGKAENAQRLECTQVVNADEEPKVVQLLKKFTTVSIIGTPYAKIGKDQNQNEVPVLAAFADKIEIISFPPKKVVDN